MSASLGVRAIATLALAVSLGVTYQSRVGAAQPDTEMRINVIAGVVDRVQPLGNTPPKGFATVTFNDRRWAHASASVCADPTWSIPQGAGPWIWASTCSSRTAALLVRRSFIIPAATVLTGRLALAIHGVGTAYLNNHAIGQSIGNPVLVDVTQYLRPNGAKNVLAIQAGAVNGDTGLGISYNLQLIISTNKFKAFTRTHRGPFLPPPPGLSNSTVLGTPTPATGPTGQGACTTNALPGVVQVFTPPSSLIPNVTGWARTVNTQHIYLATRQIDPTKIASPSDMPSAKIAGNNVRSNVLILDDTTGMEVLDLPFHNDIGTLAVGNPHNQSVGQAAAVTAFSVAQNCMATYSTLVKKYLSQQDGSRVAQIDTVPFQDGADGGVAFDNAGNLLGVLIFDRAILDEQNRVAPLILAASTVLPNVDYLIAVLNKQKDATSSEHVISVVTNADGSQSVTHVDGNATPVPNATSGAATPAPSGTPAPAGTPAPSDTPAAPSTPASGTPAPSATGSH